MFVAVEETGLPQKTIERVVEDVVSLRLARREKVSGKWHVTPSRIAREYWAGERSPEKSDPSQNDRVELSDEEIAAIGTMSFAELEERGPA